MKALVTKTVGILAGTAALVALAAGPASAASSWTTTAPSGASCSSWLITGGAWYESCIQINANHTQARAITVVRDADAASSTYQVSHEVRNASTNAVLGNYSSTCSNRVIANATIAYCVGPWTTKSSTQVVKTTTSSAFKNGSSVSGIPTSPTAS